jgi:hypothetical protein
MVAYQDAIQHTSVAAGDLSSVAEPLRIFSNYTASPSRRPTTSAIASILCFNAQLSGTDLDNVRAYLATKYGVQSVIPGGAPTLWLRSDRINGSPIDSITDVGSAAGSVSQTGTARPSVVTVGGQNGASFDGSNDLLDTGPLLSTVITAGAYSAFIVFKANALAGATGFSYDAAALLNDANGVGGGNWCPFVLVAAGLYGGHYNASDIAMTSPIGINTGTLYIAQVIFGSGTITWKCNGITRTTTGAANVGSLSNPAQLITLGANYNHAAFANAEVYETLVYNTALSAADQATALVYLQRRFPTAKVP